MTSPTLFTTIDAVRGSPELAQFQFRSSNEWISGTHSRSLIQGFYGAGQEDTTRTVPFTYDADHPAVLVALPLAGWSATAQHLLHRVYGTMIRPARDVDSARAVVDQAAATLAQEDSCPFCSIMLAVPAAAACADAGDLDDARAYLAAAERSAALWKGNSWQAAITEARAHLDRAEGDAGAARARLFEAAELFAAAGQPLDADRCLA